LAPAIGERIDELLDQTWRPEYQYHTFQTAARYLAKRRRFPALLFLFQWRAVDVHDAERDYFSFFTTKMGRTTGIQIVREAANRGDQTAQQILRVHLGRDYEDQEEEEEEDESEEEEENQANE